MSTQFPDGARRGRTVTPQREDRTRRLAANQMQGGGPPGPDGSAPSTGKPRRRLLAAAMVLVVLVAAGITWWGLAAAPQTEVQVQLETVASSGPAPFTTPAGSDATGVVAPADAGGELAGDTGGLYARNPGRPSCDAQSLIGQLTADPAKAAAWAAPMGTSAAGIGAFVAGLAPTTVRADTAVTEYGYGGGQFQPYPAVLQAGTAVLVNSYGEPTVKCYSGNPLGRPTASNDTSNYVGAPWSGFAAERTIRITPTAAPLTALPVLNTVTNTQTPAPVRPDARPTPGPNPAPATGEGGTLQLTGTHNYDGTITLSDGRIIKPGGEVVPPKVPVTHPPGSTTLADGAIQHPNGLVYNRDGTRRLPLRLYPSGIILKIDGTTIPPVPGELFRWNYDGTVTTFKPGSNQPVVIIGADGKIIQATQVPAGSVVLADGSVKDAAGNVTNPVGTSRQTTSLPGGTVLDQNGGNTPPEEIRTDPNTVKPIQTDEAGNPVSPGRPGAPDELDGPVGPDGDPPIDPQGEGRQGCPPGTAPEACRAPAAEPGAPVQPDGQPDPRGAAGGAEGNAPGAAEGGADGGDGGGGDGAGGGGGDGAGGNGGAN